MIITWKSNVTQFNDVLAKYAAASGATLPQALVKKTADLGFALARRLRVLAPKKSAIRSERLAAMERGEGTLVRPRILEKTFAALGAHTDIASRQLRFFRGKTSARSAIRGKQRSVVNLWALAVKRELSARESGRGYLAFGSSLRGASRLTPGTLMHFLGRYRQKLASAVVRRHSRGAESRIKLGGPNVALAAGLLKPKGQAAVAAALNDVRQDMLTYIKRKQLEAAQRAGFKNVKGVAGTIATASA